MKLDFLATYEFLRIALANISTITKQEFLQLITLNHDRKWEDGSKNNIKETLDLIPNVINAETFEDLIFIDRIENDLDCPFFEIYFDNFRKALDENPKLSEMIFDKLQETFGAIPTFTMNQNGELEPTNPNLKRIK